MRNEAIICPYCNHKFSDSWEYSEEYNEQRINCESCDKVFSLYVECEVFYKVSKIKVKP